MKRRTPLFLSEDRVEKLSSTVKRGDVFCGTVVGRLDKERYVVHFNNTDCIAGYRGFLRAGQTIRTIVQSVSPQIVFKILSEYELPFDIDEHLKRLRDLSMRMPALLIITPSMGMLVKAVLDLCGQHDLPVLAKQPLDGIRARIAACLRKELFFDCAAERCDLVDEMQRRRFCCYETIPALLQTEIKEIDDTIGRWGARAHEDTVHWCEKVREGIRKIVIHMIVEKTVNERSLAAKRGIRLLQYVLTATEDIFGITFCCHEALPGQIRIFDGLHYCDSMIEHEKQDLFFSSKPPSYALGCMMTLFQKAGYTIQEKIIGNTFERCLEGLPVREFPLFSPVRCNVMA